jgi:hypothetical protein
MIPFDKFSQQENIPITILRLWRSRHGLPVITIGRRLYIDEKDYEQWINSHKQVSEKPIEKSMELSIPKKLRGGSIANKMKRIY